VHLLDQRGTKCFGKRRFQWHVQTPWTWHEWLKPS
jgi:hypothetical protein